MTLRQRLRRQIVLAAPTCALWDLKPDHDRYYFTPYWIAGSNFRIWMALKMWRPGRWGWAWIDRTELAEAQA